MQGLVSAHPFEGAFAKHAKNLYLRVRVDFTDFVQKQGPPDACSNRPIRRSKAPVNAPRSCPNSSLSRSCGENALQCTAMNFFAARVLSA